MAALIYYYHMKIIFQFGFWNFLLWEFLNPFIWHSPCESRLHSNSKKAYNKITQICFFYSRLEDQLHLIHERFQELSMKFEMFQQQPSVEYEPRLARVARQLRDIKEKVRTNQINKLRLRYQLWVNKIVNNRNLGILLHK